jgi:hypothetical protein
MSDAREIGSVIETLRLFAQSLSNAVVTPDDPGMGDTARAAQAMFGVQANDPLQAIVWLEGIRDGEWVRKGA